MSEWNKYAEKKPPVGYTILCGSRDGAIWLATYKPQVQGRYKWNFTEVSCCGEDTEDPEYWAFLDIIPPLPKDNE